MKKAILLSIALLLISGAVSAQGGYIGLFLDDAHSTWCATGVGFYPIEMWIWTLPGAEGLICAEFMICYPANVIQSTVTPNLALSVTLGDLPSGMSACFTNCNYDWVWPHHQMLYVTDPTLTHIYVCPHPSTGMITIANCLPGYPTEPVTVLSNLYINYPLDSAECSGWGVEETSWGAIKGMFE